MRFGVSELLLIGVVALLVFGPKRLPEVGKALGRAVSEFRAGLRGDDQPTDTNAAPQPRR